MISHERTKITRNKAFELNRQIGNAASRIQHVGSNESSGGAGFQTEIALSTAIADRPIVGERYAEKKFSQKKPRAVLGRNEMSIFADPADTRDAGKFSLQPEALGADQETTNRLRERPLLSGPWVVFRLRARQQISAQFGRWVFGGMV